MHSRSLIVIASLLLAWTTTSTVEAAAPVFVQNVRFHGFDQSIASALGYESSSVLYIREMASITEDQRRLRAQYEPIGCHPFYIMLDGKIAESGYDCRSFFCVGYIKGPKQCRDVSGRAYGGVVEISNRLGLVTIQDTKKLYTDYAPADRLEAMNKRIEEMEAIHCTPFFIQEFDVVVGDGYQCREVGRYPRYSGSFTCSVDSRNTEGLTCTIAVRENELAYRAELLAGTAESSVSSSSGSSVSSGSSASSVQSSQGASSSAASSLPLVIFPDIEKGRYGYTAIVSLATRGIIKGYPDGTFQPANAVNRAEFLHLLVTSVHPAERQGDAWCFPDAVADWYAEAVCAGKRLGWVSGYLDGKFHPERTMRKSEAIKVIVSSLGLPIASTAPLPAGVIDSAWYSPYVRKAVELGILLEPSFAAEAHVTRADTAVWMYRALKVMESL